MRKGSSDFLSNLFFNEHAWSLSKCVCPVLWLSFPLGLSLISRVERKTSVSQMVVFSQTLSPHHEGVMKITTFLSVNNENLGAIARMSNGT